MPEKTHDEELAALKADIASLREDLAGLAAGVKKSAGVQAKQMREAVHGQEPESSGEGQGLFTDLLHKADSSRVQGEKVLKGLAAEVEHLPLVSVLAAFGIGYIIAKLWYQENRE